MLHKGFRGLLPLFPYIYPFLFSGFCFVYGCFSGVCSCFLPCILLYFSLEL